MPLSDFYYLHIRSKEYHQSLAVDFFLYTAVYIDKPKSREERLSFEFFGQSSRPFALPPVCFSSTENRTMCKNILANTQNILVVPEISSAAFMKMRTLGKNFSCKYFGSCSKSRNIVDGLSERLAPPCMLGVFCVTDNESMS